MLPIVLRNLSDIKSARQAQKALIQSAGTHVNVLVTVHPEFAQAAIDHLNQVNRTRRPARVGLLAAYMRSPGKWEISDESRISFTESNDQVQGGHRMAACVLAGIPFTTYANFFGKLSDKSIGGDVEAYNAADHAEAIAGEKIANVGALKNIARAYLTRGGSAAMNPTRVAETMIEIQDVAKKYITLSKKKSAPVAAAFVAAELLGHTKSEAAAERLLAQRWDSEEDPMRHLSLVLEGVKGKNTNEQNRKKFSYAADAIMLVAAGKGSKGLRIRKDDNGDLVFKSVERA